MDKYDDSVIIEEIEKIIHQKLDELDSMNKPKSNVKSDGTYRLKAGDVEAEFYTQIVHRSNSDSVQNSLGKESQNGVAYDLPNNVRNYIIDNGLQEVYNQCVLLYGEEKTKIEWEKVLEKKQQKEGVSKTAEEISTSKHLDTDTELEKLLNSLQSRNIIVTNYIFSSDNQAPYISFFYNQESANFVNNIISSISLTEFGDEANLTVGFVCTQQGIQVYITCAPGKNNGECFRKINNLLVNEDSCPSFSGIADDILRIHKISCSAVGQFNFFFSINQSSMVLSLCELEENLITKSIGSPDDINENIESLRNSNGEEFFLGSFLCNEESLHGFTNELSKGYQALNIK